MRTLKYALIPLLALAAAVLAKTAEPAGKKAEEQYKNIQVFKGIPAEDLVPAMQFMSAALGEECEFCHVDRAPEKDDKEHKQVARKMIAMTQGINRDHFGGKQEVTCFSCHRGSEHPLTVPLVASTEVAPEPPAPAPAASLPEPAAVLDKYLAASGGAEALAKVTTRVQKGSLTGFGEAPVQVEILAKAPNKRVSIVKRPRGDSKTAFDGEHGWLAGPGRPPRDMAGAEVDAARFDAQLALPAEIKKLFSETRTRRGEKIDGRDTVLVVGTNPGAPPVELWFDAESGLLLRQKRYVATPLGRLPTEVDYGDYREADGIKVPFRWSVARPSGRFTIQVEEMRQNVPVDDAAFRKPAPPPEEAPK